MGTVLNTFTCADPDSPGSILDYQLQFHSPPGSASLCLRDRVLEVPSPCLLTHMQGAGDCKVEGSGGKGLWELRPLP